MPHYFYGIDNYYNGGFLQSFLEKNFQKTNIIAVETVGENRASVFKIYPNQLKKGREEFYDLMKRVGICEMFGYDDTIEFV